MHATRPAHLIVLDLKRKSHEAPFMSICAWKSMHHGHLATINTNRSFHSLHLIAGQIPPTKLRLIKNMNSKYNVITTVCAYFL